MIHTLFDSALGRSHDKFRSLKSFGVQRRSLVLTCLIVSLVGFQPALYAGSASNPVTQTAVQGMDCMADLLGQALSCGSNDIQLAAGEVVQVSGGPECVAGQMIEVEVRANLQMNANSDRYDVILWSALSAQNIQTPAPNGQPAAQCYASSLPDRDENGLPTDFVEDLEASENYTSDTQDEIQAPANERDALDQCRDIVADGSDPLIEQDMTLTQNVFLPCIDTDDDGFVNAQFLVTWASNADTIEACGSGGAAFGPGLTSQQTSKCDSVAGNLPVAVVVPASLTIVKNTVGGNGSFSFTTSGFDPTSPLDNGTGSFVLDTGAANPASVTDDQIEVVDVNGEPFSVAETVPAGWDLTSATCSNGQTPDALTLFQGDAVTCTFVNTRQVPSIDIVKKAAPLTYSAVGNVINYTFDVSNDGTAPLTSIAVTDPLAGLSAIDCGSGSNVIASLAPTATVQCSASLTITQAHLDAGSVGNTATATGSSPFGTNDVTDSGTANVTSTAVPRIGLVKSATPTMFDATNVVINYTFRVTNTGALTLSNVTVSDPLSGLSAIDCGSGSNVIASLAPSEFVDCTGTYSTTQTDLNNGRIDNTATATGTPPSGPDVSATSSFTVFASNVPNVAIDKTANPTTFDQTGVVITYTMAVTNPGNTTLTDVTVTDPLAGLSAIDCGSGSHVIASLDSGAGPVNCTATLTTTQDHLDAGQIANTASVVGDAGDAGQVSDTDDALVTAEQNPAISLVKSGVLDDGGDGVADAGDTITYSFTVENTGNVTLHNITLDDPVLDVLGGPIAMLAPGDQDTGTFTGTYQLTQPDIDAGSFTNTATVDSDEGASAEDSDTQTLAAAPSMELVKTGVLSDGGDGNVNAGDTITYSFSVTNTGNVTLTTITLSDPKTNILGGPIASLAPGDTDSTSFTGTHNLTQAEINAGVYTNTATANSTQGATAQDSDTQTLAAEPALTLDKVGTLNEGDGGFVLAGDTITYAFIVQNTGNITLTNITVMDANPDVTVSGSIASLASGQTDTTSITGSYVLKQADVDAGTFTNVATATADEGATDQDDDTQVLTPPPPPPPPTVEVSTLNHYGLALLALLMLGVGFVGYRRFL